MCQINLSKIYLCGIYSNMNAQAFEQLVLNRLRETGETPIGAAVRHGLPRDAIRSVLRGHPPLLPRAAEICDALGLVLHIEPKQESVNTVTDGANVFRAIPANFRQTPGIAIQDHQVASIAYALASAYENLNTYGKEMMIIRFKHAFPELIDESNCE